MAPISSPNACAEARRSTAKASRSLIAASTSCGDRGWSPGRHAQPHTGTAVPGYTAGDTVQPQERRVTPAPPPRLLQTPLDRHTPHTRYSGTQTDRHTEPAVPLTHAHTGEDKHTLTRLCTSRIHTFPNIHTQRDTSPSYTYRGAHASTYKFIERATHLKRCSHPRRDVHTHKDRDTCVQRCTLIALHIQTDT